MQLAAAIVVTLISTMIVASTVGFLAGLRAGVGRGIAIGWDDAETLAERTRMMERRYGEDTTQWPIDLLPKDRLKRKMVLGTLLRKDLKRRTTWVKK